MPSHLFLHLTRCIFVLGFLLLSEPVPAAPDPSPTGGAKGDFVASPATVTTALQDAATKLKQSIASIRSRAVEAKDALVLAQKAMEDFRAETIALKALLVLEQFPLNRVEGVYAAYSARASRLAASQQQLTEEMGRLRQDAANKLAAIDQIEKDLLMTSAGKEPDDARSELEAAFDGYRRMVASEEREMARLVEIYEKTGEFFQTEKTLVGEILPLLEKQRESWKQEILKRQEHLSLRQQVLEIWQSVAAVPDRAHQWSVKLARSGTVEDFVGSRPMAFSGLVLLIILLTWSARRLKHLAVEKLESWKSPGGPPLTQWAIAAGQEVAARTYPIGLTLWLVLTLRTIGLLETAPARLTLIGLITLILLSLSLGLLRITYETAVHEESKLLTEAAARFYRRRIKLFTVWTFLGGLALYGLPVLGFPLTISLLARILYFTGMLYFVVRMTRPARVDSLLSVFPDAQLKLRRWVMLLGRARYALIGVLVIALMAYPLGFQPLAAHLVESTALSLGLTAAWLAAILGGRSVAHYLLHAENGWLGRRFPDRSEWLDRLCALVQRSLDGLFTACAVVGLFHIWGLAPNSLLKVLHWLQYGISFGASQISPLNVILGILVLYLGFRLSRFTTRLLQTRVFPKTGWDIGIQYTISTILEYVILILGILMTLNVMGFPLANLALIMGALGVGIGLGLQNIVSNFFSGLVLLIERPIKVGDLLVIDGQWGEVKQIRIRSTVFQTFDKSVMIIPNSELTASKILNWTHYGRGSSRISLKVGVAYGTDISFVTQLLKDACASNGRVLRDPAPQVLFTTYGESSLDFSIMAHVAAPEDRMPATHELNSAIFDLFREHDIEIPFPQRDLTIKNWPQGLLK